MIIIMFSMIHDIRKQLMEFTLKVKRVEYMVRCIWLTLQAHAVLDGFVKRGLKYNSTISAAFCFLTKQTGQNVSTGVRSQIKVSRRCLRSTSKWPRRLQMLSRRLPGSRRRPALGLTRRLWQQTRLRLTSKPFWQRTQTSNDPDLWGRWALWRPLWRLASPWWRGRALLWRLVRWRRVGLPSIFQLQ